MPSISCAGSPGRTSSTAKTTSDATNSVATPMHEALEEVGGHGSLAVRVDQSPTRRRAPSVLPDISPSRGADQRLVPASSSAEDGDSDAADLPPWGEMSGRQRGREASPLAEVRSTYSAHFTLVRSLAWIGAFSHRPFDLGVPDADLRQFEQEAVDRVVGEDLLRLLVELGALGLVGGQVQLVDDLVEGRVVVVEVVVLARIDIDVVRLGVRDDGEVVVLVGEDLLQPVGPFDRDDLQIDADLAQLRGDDLAAVAGIGDGGSFSVALKPSAKPASFSSSLALARSYG